MRSLFAAILWATPLAAETVIATQTLRPREPITANMVIVSDVEVEGAARLLDDVIGSEVRYAVYTGQPVLQSNLSAAALVERNEVVTTIYAHGGLKIETEARSLERGAAGDIIRAVNLVSRQTITAKVQADGTLRVLP